MIYILSVAQGKNQTQNVYNDLHGKPEISWRIEEKNIKRERTDSGKFPEIYPWQLYNNQPMISTLFKKLKKPGKFIRIRINP